MTIAFYPPHAGLAESPLWRAHDNTLHYVDMHGNSIHVLCLDEPLQMRIIPVPEPITFLTFHQQGGYIVSSPQVLAHVDENGRWTVLQKIISDEQKEEANLNDGAVDSRGRLWIGSLDRGDATPRRRTLYCYDINGQLTIHETGLGTSNGLGWTADEATMFVTDSHAEIIWAYDFDAAAGAIANRRMFIDRRGLQGKPDGLLVDIDGNVLVFLWEGAAVAK